jgi:hypothetical protein
MYVYAAQAYLDRKIMTLRENLLLAQRALMTKRSDYGSITTALQQKIATIRAQSEHMQQQQKKMLA